MRAVPMRAVHLADDTTILDMGVGFHGAFMDATTYAGLVLGNEAARIRS